MHRQSKSCTVIAEFCVQIKLQNFVNSLQVNSTHEEGPNDGDKGSIKGKLSGMFSSLHRYEQENRQFYFICLFRNTSTFACTLNKVISINTLVCVNPTYFPLINNYKGKG